MVHPTTFTYSIDQWQRGLCTCHYDGSYGHTCHIYNIIWKYELNLIQRSTASKRHDIVLSYSSCRETTKILCGQLNARCTTCCKFYTKHEIVHKESSLILHSKRRFSGPILVRRDKINLSTPAK